MATRIYVLRHGQSEANVSGLIASDPDNAERFGLTQMGREQVAETVRKADNGGALDHPVTIVTSPLLRARQTAEIASEITGGDVRTDPQLRERGFGEFELGSDAAYTRVWEEDVVDPAHTEWGVESVRAVLVRAGQVVVDAAAGHAGGSVVLCTHGDVASTLLCASKGIGLEHHREVGGLATGQLAELRDLAALHQAVTAASRPDPGARPG